MLYTITLIEDDIKLAKLFADLLNADKSLGVSFVYHSFAQTISSFESNPTDIALVDIQLPDGNGIEIVEKFKPKMPNTHFIMCTSFDDDDKVFNSLKAGANGYIIKSNDALDIVGAIHTVIAGGASMSPGIAMKVVKYFQKLPKDVMKMQELTDKENNILALLAKGYLYKEIAVQCEVTIDTIKKHCGNIYRKLQVNNRTEAINRYLGR